MSAGHGNGNSYSTKMIKRTFWCCLMAAFAVMVWGAADGLIWHDGVPQWVGAMFWSTLGAAAVISAIRAIFNKA